MPEKPLWHIAALHGLIWSYRKHFYYVGHFLSFLFLWYNMNQTILWYMYFNSWQHKVEVRKNSISTIHFKFINDRQHQKGIHKNIFGRNIKNPKFTPKKLNLQYRHKLTDLCASWDRENVTGKHAVVWQTTLIFTPTYFAVSMSADNRFIPSENNS